MVYSNIGPSPRAKVHYRKYLGGENHDQQDVWIIVEILDEMHVWTGSGPSYQGQIYKFLYGDPGYDNFDDCAKAPGDPDTFNYYGDGEHRQVYILRIHDPSDDSNFVDIPVVYATSTETGSGESYQGTETRFDNNYFSNVRQTHVKWVEKTLPMEVIDASATDEFKNFLWQGSIWGFLDQGDETNFPNDPPDTLPAGDWKGRDGMSQ